MRTRRLWFMAMLAMTPSLAAGPALAKQPEGSAQDKAAIAKNAETFIEAFQKGDAKALAALWTPDADYTAQTGRQLKGRDAIEQAFAGLFADNKGLKLRIDSDSLRFITPDVAVEDGMTGVFNADGGPPVRTRYTIVHVKKDGQWLLSSVRDAPYTAPTNYELLRGLEWAIGDWAEDTDKGAVERLSFAWAENQNFVVASFSSTFKSITLASAKIWIGWDPAAKNLRSWMFDADGGFGEGSWTQDGKKWVVKTTATLRDGKKASATYVVAPVDADTISLQAKDRSVDGERIPDGGEIKLKRVK